MSDISVIFEEIKIIAVNINFYKEYVMAQRFGEAGTLFGKISNGLGSICDFLTANNITDNAQFTEIVMSLNNALVAEDLVFLSDLLQQLVTPLLENALIYIFSNYSSEDIGLLGEVQCQEGNRIYSIEYNNCGEPVLASCSSDKKIYYHSNICAKLDGYRFAKCYADSQYDTYLVLGLGLGYHIAELERISYGAKIIVYESSMTVIELYKKYGVKINAEIIYDKNYTELSRALKGYNEHMALAIHRPTLITIDNDDMRKSFENFFWIQNSLQDQIGAMKWNFRNNCKLSVDSVWVLKPVLEAKEIIMVAGGPSLDKDIDYIKKYRDNRIVVCVGTVYKLLLNNGIIPDYVVIIDVKNNMQLQVLGTCSDAGLIFLSTANHKACLEYAGEKYIAYQAGFDLAEQVANENKEELFESGGSVACFVVDMLIRMQVQRVICIGLDLAYTNGLNHASDTHFARKAKGSRMCMGVDGSMINTAPNFEIYRNWIEKRIANTNIEFINTAKGAYIKGMKHIDACEVLKEE